MQRLLLLGLSGLILAQRVEIRRDSFGTPYIFGVRDADCAYGLAWAHAEDDFGRIQYLMALAQGRLGRLLGKRGAIGDYFAHFTGAFHLARQQYDSLSPALRAILESYAEGLNAYAQAHPQEVVDKALFPVKGEDILRGYIIVLAGMVGVGQALQAVFQGRAESYAFEVQAGSNGIAVSSARSADGHTYLVINPHVPLEGLLRWYEAFLHSEEGWHILGGFFPGAVVPGLGTNPYLGWAMTFNWPDFVDIYRLRMHPKNPRLYWVDGKWDTLQAERVWLHVRLIGRRLEFVHGWPVGGLKRARGPVIPIRQKIERSRFGPIVRTKKGVYALRFAAERFFRAPQQWYEMGKARSFAEFYQALRLQGIPLFNIVYADRQDTIYYLFNALLPERSPGYNWQSVLPGDTTATLWKRYLTIEELPQVLAPKCGVVFSVNNSPFGTTCPEEAPRQADFPPYHGWEWNRHNNRERRLHELIFAKERISWEDFKAIKYDRQYPREGPIGKIWISYATLPDTGAPPLREALGVIRNWDLSGSGRSRAASLLSLAIAYALKKAGLPAYNWLEEGKATFPAQLLWESLRYATQQLYRYYRDIAPPLEKVQALEIKGKRYPFDGLPEQLAPTYAIWDEKRGFLRVIAGDTYIQFVRFLREARYPQVESVLPLGISGKPNSPHYDDQLPLYLKRQCKPMTLNPEEIRARTVCTHVFMRP
ncbi:MAG: penicillin acylase family protein [Bacteroidia bacterium]|nr:penicillin acylase family protein [Bacteroidia bacterium]MDW8088987.1 penicillin acylase family protein [Bacteroidia bacterium]